MALFRCNNCCCVYEDYYPPDYIWLKCKFGTNNVVTSGGYALSTKTVDNPVNTVDMFQNCHVNSSGLSVCILNSHGMQLPVIACQLFYFTCMQTFNLRTN